MRKCKRVDTNYARYVVACKLSFRCVFNPITNTLDGTQYQSAFASEDFRKYERDLTAYRSWQLCYSLGDVHKTATKLIVEKPRLALYCTMLLAY